MAKYRKRTMVVINPEWEPDLEQLKKEKFYNNTQAEMFRYVIQVGLDTFHAKRRLEDKP